jgi:hypothetical protein
MIIRKPLKQILIATRAQWDHPDTRPAVRENFRKVIDCGTLALGAEVYASANEEKVVPHTCKSRACPSCGHRATKLWQREQWTALPDIAYAGINLTMPDVLWPIFQKNRHLLHDLPALGAAAIQQCMNEQYGVRVLIMVVPHTFGRHLNFNSHLHILISAGGLRESDGRWIPRLYLAWGALMRAWRDAVITYLREALKIRLITTDLTVEELAAILSRQHCRKWNVYIARFQSKQHFLRYAGRYVRHPPIAEYRFVEVAARQVQFLTKDLKLKMVVTTWYRIEEFVAALAEHVPDHYRHAIRYFGLLAPGSKATTSAALFVVSGQRKHPRPRRLGWRNSLRKHFNVDPLIDSVGQPMRWVRRLKPATA